MVARTSGCLNRRVNNSIWTGSRVRLRGVEPEDWEQFHGFDQDSLSARSADIARPPRSEAGTREWAEETSTRKSSGDDVQLAIENLEGDLVGSMAISGSDPRAGRFSYGLAIGREFHRRGYASDAIVLLLRFMFGERRYHKAEADVYAYNEASLGLHDHLGFQREGLLRDHEFFGGRHYDVVIFGMTADEFAERHPYAPVV